MKSFNKYSVYFIRIIILYVFFITGLLYKECKGSVLDLPAGARPVSLGGAYTAVPGTPEGVFFNPATLSTSDIFGVSFFATNIFQMKELQYTASALNIPLVIGSAGVALKFFGNSLYSESTFGLGWASSLTSKFHMGLLVRRNQLRIKNYGSDVMWLVDLGILIELKKKILIGGSVINLKKRSDSAYQHSVPLTYRGGCRWEIVKDFLVVLDLIGGEKIKVHSRCGCEYMIRRNIWLRMGFESYPGCFSSGIGVKWKVIHIDYALRYHNYLGSTHYCSVSFYLE